MIFINNSHYKDFFASIGEAFLIIVFVQLGLNLIGYKGLLLEQKGIYVALGLLAGYLFGLILDYLGNKIIPD
jgi:hypothetical protein